MSFYTSQDHPQANTKWSSLSLSLNFQLKFFFKLNYDFSPCGYITFTLLTKKNFNI
ncbi:hypothetical protein HanPSC8_Chr12g0506701 [Helianthus annuus]|nr:hypothetical protein HanPSC8_Chr12g0506701 [Helianthus annuus]